MRSVSLLFGVHAHQPVGNFDEVLADANARCYSPFFRTVYRYPRFRFAVHFSGWLLAWIAQRYPADMALMREMVARGQMELFGGGDTEPVLAVIPHRDRVSQIEALSNRLERDLDDRPTGAWLTERVWEATVVPALAESGIRYVTVDDYHFLCTGREDRELNGYFSTEENGRRLDLFPISEALRYRLPFALAADAVGFIESLADEGGTAAAVYFDDIEKFGIWPETYTWVYEKGWLTAFIEGIVNSAVIRTETYRDYHARTASRGVVYLPTTSYIEMNEWTLPARRAHVFADLVARARAEGTFQRDKPHLRGGIWKNFLSRYPEGNWMHKRMLGLSERLAALPAAGPGHVDEMQSLLHEAQANDAYWHGLFGGLYLPHLRRAVWRAIVALEARLETRDPSPAVVSGDHDLDGFTERLLRTDLLRAAARDDGAAAVHELSSYRLAHNFGDTLRRSEEHYYRKIGAGVTPSHGGEGIASAHDRVSFKHTITPADLVPDSGGRTLFRDAVVAQGGSSALANYTLRQPGSDPRLSFSALAGGGRIDKQVQLEGERIAVAYTGHGFRAAALVVEINLAMPSCDGPAGRYWLKGACPGGFGQPLAAEACDSLTLEDDVLGGAIVLSSTVPLPVEAAPHFTVSQSEGGFEKIMQAVTLTVTIPGGALARGVTLALEVVGKRK